MGNPKGGKNKRTPPPPPSKLTPWLPAVTALAVAVVLALLAKAFAPPVHFLSTYNRNQMKEVFLGKGTWAVLCSGEGAAYDAVFKRFGTASKAMKGSTKFGVVDCTGSLPSGKSILQKFELSEEISPVLFVTGGGVAPVQASARNMETHGSVLKWVQATVTPAASVVKSTREMESKCLKKEQCALIMKAGPLEDEVRDAFKELMTRHRSLRFVSVDSTKLEMGIEKKKGVKVDGSHRLVHFTRYNISADAKVGTPRWGMQVYDGSLDADSMSIFIEAAAVGSTKDKTPLTRIPTVMTRKEPKAKPPPPAPKPRPSRPRPDDAAAAADEAETSVGEETGAAAGGEGGKYDGMTLDEVVKKRQVLLEAARRRAMDKEADNYLFESPDEDDEEGARGGGLEGDEYRGGEDEEKEEEDEEDEEEMVDLDDL